MQLWLRGKATGLWGVEHAPSTVSNQSDNRYVQKRKGFLKEWILKERMNWVYKRADESVFILAHEGKKLLSRCNGRNDIFLVAPHPDFGDAMPIGYTQKS